MLTHIVALVRVEEELEAFRAQVGAREAHDIRAMDGRVAETEHTLSVLVFLANSLQIVHHQETPGPLVGPVCEGLEHRSVVHGVDVAAVVGVPDPVAFENFLHVVELSGWSRTHFQSGDLSELHLLYVLEV